jgi:two-component system, OmpR family, phosphate regulon sensor histidine kinase PhoR
MLSFLIIPWILYFLDQMGLFASLIITALFVAFIMFVFFLNHQFQKKTILESQSYLEIIQLIQPSKIENKTSNDTVYDKNVMIQYIQDMQENLQTQVLRSERYRKRLRLILDGLQLGILLIDKDYKITYYNKKMHLFFHLMDKDMGQSIDQLELPLAFISVIHEAVSKGSIRKDIDFKNKLYDVQVTPFLKTESNETLVLIVVDDVSLERSTEQMKKDFFSYASHELKTPITSIKGFAELVLYDMVSKEEAKKALTSIVTQSDTMTTLVEDMLMLSRLENYKESKQTHINLKEKLKEVLVTLKPIIEQKNIIITQDVHMINMVCDPMDMFKLFKNIIENSIKYSKDYAKVTIKLNQVNQEMMFVVKDEGFGIPSIHQSRIFERFYRVDEYRGEGGTGLGLAIVKHIVMKYNGSIELESKVNQGTLVEVVLPIQKKNQVNT